MVRHSVFGPGRVVLATWTRVWVYFPDLPGAATDAVKELATDSAQLEPAPGLVDSRLVHVPVKLVNGVLEFPKATRISHKDAVTHFLRQYPKGFKDPTLIKREIGYKRDAVALFQKYFGRGAGKKLLAKKRLEQIASHIDDLFHATNIPALQEILAVRDGVRDREAAGRFLVGVLNFMDKANATTFGQLVEAVDRLPAELGKARVLTWPIVTLLPFFADPRRFIVLKPTMTQTAAERLFFDLASSAHPIGPPMNGR